MYAPSTPPAVFAKPPTMMAINSDRVIFSRNGRMTRGASVCPTKMFAEFDSDSAPETRMVFAMILAKSSTSTPTVLALQFAEHVLRSDE